MSQLASPTTRVPALSASAISDSVPYSPPDHDAELRELRAHLLGDVEDVEADVAAATDDRDVRRAGHGAVSARRR